MATGTVEFKVKITDAFIPLNPRSSKTVLGDGLPIDVECAGD